MCKYFDKIILLVSLLRIPNGMRILGLTSSVKGWAFQVLASGIEEVRHFHPMGSENL